MSLFSSWMLSANTHIGTDDGKSVLTELTRDTNHQHSIPKTC